MAYDRMSLLINGLGLRARILLLGLACILPIMMVEVYSAHETAQQNLAEAHERARILVEKSNDQYDDLIVQARTILHFLTIAPEVRSLDQPACNRMMADIKARYPWMVALTVVKADGIPACTSLQMNQSYNFSTNPYFQHALAAKTFTISNFHIGQISGKPVVSAMQPMLDENGKVIAIVGTGINLDVFNAMLADNEASSHFSVSIFDAAGSIIGRFPNGDKFLGQNMSDTPLFRKVQADGTGEIETIGLGGDERIFAFQPFAETPAYIAVGIPKQPILDAINHRLYRNLLLIGAVILGSCLLGGAIAEMLIVRPTRKLTDAAVAVGSGEFGTVPDIKSSIPEMRQLLTAFRGMARQLRQREQDLKDSEAATLEINRNLLLGEQMANAGYWRVDYPSQRLTWSDGVYRIYGRDPATFPVTLASSIANIHPDDRQESAETIEMAFALQRDYEHTIRIVRPDGEIRHVVSRGFCEIGADGSVSSLFGVIVDITVLKEIEAELRAARQTADEASRAKSDFLSSMSHELRTPLTSVIGFADLMLMQDSSEEMKRYLTLQRDAGHHLMNLINDILDHSKITEGKLQLEAIPFDLPALITSCREVMAPQAARKALDLTSTVSVLTPNTLVGDPGRLKQVLLNLLSNAIKFTSSGSVDLTVDITGVAGDVVALKFSVRDTGIGIPADRLHTLFQRFSQATSATTRQFGGTGLGLSISKGLVEAMGGSMGVESTPGIGSAFWFTLRLLSVSDIKVDTPPLPEETQHHHARILLADDSIANQVLFSEILHSLGHEVITVDNGAQAVEAVQTGRFDMVLMDMQMPVMDGLTATQAIRVFRDSSLPIVGLTASAMQEDVERCMTAGMTAHLAKPVDIAALADMIERMTAA